MDDVLQEKGMEEDRMENERRRFPCMNIGRNQQVGRRSAPLHDCTCAHIYILSLGI